MKHLSYYDGYFFHHIWIFASKGWNGKFLPKYRKSGSGDQFVREGEPDMRGYSYNRPDNRPVKEFDTEEEALACAEEYVDKTTGVYCLHQHYSPSGIYPKTLSEVKSYPKD